MEINELYHYKTAYKIFNFLKFKNHPNLIINYPFDKKNFIFTILNNVYNIKTKNILSENYEYNNIYYYFDANVIKVDLKNTFINEIYNIIKSYNYYKDEFNYIIIDNYENINNILENKLKVIVEKFSNTTKFIFLTSNINNLEPTIKSRFFVINIPKLSIYDKQKIFLKYKNHKNFDNIIKKDDLNLIEKEFNNFKSPIDLFFDKCLKIFDSKIDKKLVKIRELSYNIKISLINFKELQKKILSHYLQSNISNEKKTKLISNTCKNNYLMIKCYKDIIYIELYFLQIYNILND